MNANYEKRKNFVYYFSFLGVFCAILWAGFGEYCRVNSPRTPAPEIGRVYPKNYHGQIVYLNETENILMYAFPGGAFLVGVMLFIVTPKKKSPFAKKG